MLFKKKTTQKRQEQRVIIKGINGKKLLILFGKKLNLNLNLNLKVEKVEKVEREKENDKKTPPLQQVAPV